MNGIPIPDQVSLHSESLQQLAILAQIELPVWVFDLQKPGVVWANPGSLEIWDANSTEELYGRDMGSMSVTIRRQLETIQSTLERGECVRELWTLYPRQQPTSYEMLFSPLDNGHGRTLMLIQALHKIHQQPQLLHSLQAVFHTSVMISLFTETGSLVYANPAAQKYRERLPLDRCYARNSDYRFILKGLEDEGYCNCIAKIRAMGANDSGQEPPEDRWVEVDARYCYDADNGGRSILVSETDVTDSERMKQQLAYEASHDALTGLPNRHFLLQQLEQTLKHSQETQTLTGLIYIDFDDFKKVNDVLGHETGDRLLMAVARRLSESVRSVDIIGRLGGDEFVILLPQLQERASITTIARKVLANCQQPQQVNGRQLTLTATLGIACAPEDGSSPGRLLRNADTAMYAAKAAGRNTMRDFSRDMADAASRRLQLEEQLRTALAKEELSLNYQPVMDLRTGKLHSFEALLRWHSAKLGAIPPVDFIPLAESTGLIVAIGDYVLATALRQTMLWRKQYHPELGIAINVSPRQLAEASFQQTLSAQLRASGLPAHKLVIEITESVLLESNLSDHKQLGDLHDLGLVLSMDDFGTGYSSLGYLRQYPFGALKVDRSFIADIAADSNALKLVEASISMAHSLGLEVVAEGVETAEQEQILKTLGCDFAQGYRFGKPSAPEQCGVFFTP